MPVFKYFVRDRLGRKIIKKEEASSEEELIKKLRQKDLIIIKIIPLKDDASAFKRRFTHRSVKSGDLLMFAYQLATMLNAGVTLVKALDVTKCQVSSSKFYEILEKIRIEVEKGNSFSEVLGKFPKIFSGLWVSLVEIGEASGNLALVLDRLAYYLEQRAEFRRKIVSALFYPAILFMIAIGAVAFFATMIIPKFKEIFLQFDMELPHLTRLLFEGSTFISRIWFLLVILIALIAFTFYKFIHLPKGKEVFDKIMLRFPIIGPFLKEVSLERFSSEIATLLEAGVPIVYSLEISEKSATNVVLRNIIKEIKENVKRGRPLNLPLEKFTYFPPLVIQMIRIGEEVGNLADMFKKISNYYHKIIETKMARFISLFEPLMIIFIGGIIGSMVIAMYLPIFNLATLGTK